MLAACRPSESPVATPAAASARKATAAPSEPITFARHVAPIVFQHCTSCHHPGEAAPFSLLTYEDVRSHAGQIVEVTHERFMPPWLPTEGGDVFADARRLSDLELQTLRQWANAGAPQGDPADMPAPPAFAEDWQAGQPDLVLESLAYALPEQGGDVFRNFVVPIELDAPRWVESIELRPSNPAVTHHARLGVDSSYESIRRDAQDDQPGYEGMAWGQDPDGQLVIWAPGMVAHPGTPGVAWRLRPKTCLVLHAHMQPSGKAETVQFRIGIHFADAPPTQFPAMLRIGSRDVDISAGAVRHVVQDEYVLPIAVDCQRIFPHAHSLCREMSVVARLPDGTTRQLIGIKRFDENWHDAYRFQRPVRLPPGTRLKTKFIYDNTDQNVRNRHRPPQRTVYGSDADDEMADAYLQLTPVRPDQRAVLMEHYKRYDFKSQIVGYRKTLELEPDEPWSQEGIAACYLGLGKPDEAIAMLEQRLKSGPSAAFPAIALGMAKLAAGDAAGAEEQQRRAIASDDQYPLAWLGLGRSLAAQQQVEPAEEAYRRALELAPALLDARLGLADLLIDRNDFDEAAKLCEAAVGDSPDMAGAYLKLAEIDAKQRRYDEAMPHLETAHRLAPYTHPPKVLLAVYCLQNGDDARAQSLLKEALAESPDHPVAALNLGQLARRDGRSADARRYLATAASRPMPDNWPASHQQRFAVLLHRERYQLAQQLQDADLARDALRQLAKAEAPSD